MKILFTILLAASTGFAAAYFLIGSANETEWRNERANIEAQWQSEKEKLENELARVKSQPPIIEHVTTEAPAAARRSAQEILDSLLKLQPSGATRIYTIRRIVHELENLADLKEQALPAIRDFLARHSDLEYSITRSSADDNDRRGWTPPWQRSSPTTEFTLPPSLRIGLFDVLKDIGGDEAEQIMGEVLATSGRAVEVAYLARALEEIAPGKYRDDALAAAKDMLRNPITIDRPNRLDEQAEGYLYGILDLYNDGSFVEDAKRMLVNAEGRINRNAQQYLSKFQGEGMVATYYDLFNNNPSMTNNFDRMSVANQILDHVGPNAQANQFLGEVVANTNLDSRMRAFAVMRLAGGFGGEETPKDPNVARQQFSVLENLKQTTTDERLLQTIDRTQINLQNIVEGKPVENPFDRFRGGPDGGRGRRDGAPQPN